MNKNDENKLLQGINQTLQKILTTTQDSLIVELLQQGIPQDEVRIILEIGKDRVARIGKQLNKSKKSQKKT